MSKFYRRRNKDISSKKSLYLKIFIALLLIGLIVLYFISKSYNSFTQEKLSENSIFGTKDQVTITIKPGDTYSNLWSKLGLENKYYYKWYLRKNLPENQLNEGIYEIQNTSLDDILHVQLQKPLSNDLPITFLEGWNIYDIDKKLVDMGLIESGDFSLAAESITADQKRSYPFLQNALTLEGFLYPDTYNINQINFSPETLIDKMLTNFNVKVYGNLDGRLFPEDMTLVEVVTLASIVEREEQVPSNRADVAGVLLNRIRQNIMLGADITACYAYKYTESECKMNLRSHISEQNDYNTRTKQGLPKTPINNPSMSSIEAVLTNKETPYLFYLHDADGGIHFATTNAEHEQNRATYNVY